VGGVHKVSGIRATLGVRSGAASLEKFSYDDASTAGSRFRLHLTIDQSFKDRLAQAKRSTAGTGGQWSPISPPATDSLWDPVYPAADNLITDLVGTLSDGAQQGGGTCSSLVDSLTTTTPADLSDLSAVDLLPFPADWSVALADVDVDADFSPLTDARPPPPPPPATAADLASWFFLPPATDQSTHLGAPDFSAELFPVCDDVIGSSFPVGDDAPPLFIGVDDVWWNTFNVGHAISVQ